MSFIIVERSKLVEIESELELNFDFQFSIVLNSTAEIFQTSKSFSSSAWQTAVIELSLYSTTNGKRKV